MHCFPEELHTVLAFSFHWQQPCVARLGVLSIPQCRSAAFSHRPMPSQWFSSVPQFISRLRVDICPPEHQGKAVIPERSSSAPLCDLSSPSSHTPHPFSPSPCPAGIGVLWMVTGVIYFQMHVNLIDVVKFSLRSRSDTLLHGTRTDSVHYYHDGEDK